MARRYSVAAWYLEKQLKQIDALIVTAGNADQVYALGQERAALREALDYLLSAS